MSNLPPRGLSHEEREQWFADRVPKPGKRPERIIEKVVYVKVKDTKTEQQLADTLKGMEAIAARQVQPGANIPERIREFADDNLTPQQNREVMLRRLSDLGNLIQMGLGTTEHKAEYAAYNASMDWLRGG